MENYETILIIFAILTAGFFISKIVSRFLLRFMKGKQAFEKKETLQTITERMIITFTVVAAIFYLGETTEREVLQSFLDVLPNILIALLVLTLGSIVINLIMWFLKSLLYYTYIEEFLPEEVRQTAMPVVLIFIRVVLYILLLDIIFGLIVLPGFQTVLSFILYPMLVLFFVILIVGLVNPIRDLSAKFYLTNLIHFRPGHFVTIDNKQYTIKKIKNFHTELTDNKDNLVIYPHRELSSKAISFKKPMKELETLEDLQKMYVAQLKSHCGPASAQMALSIFNYEHPQEELGKLMKTATRKSEKDVAGTHPQEIINAVEKVTKKKVRGVWVGFEKIYDLKNELITWLNQGALIIVDYKKNYLFPQAKYAHYSLLVGVRGDEFLIVDPSGVSGGVYYVDYRDILIGMDTYSELIKGKRGYIVLAPEGTEAHQRIKDGIIYYHPSMYDRLTKNIEVYLSRLSHPKVISYIIPERIRKNLNALQPKEQVRRVWKPENKDK
ncbi:MAG: C39 family peptidase [Candidatus Nanoarchaeia archaeon]